MTSLNTPNAAQHTASALESGAEWAAAAAAAATAAAAAAPPRLP